MNEEIMKLLDNLITCGESMALARNLKTYIPKENANAICHRKHC